MWAGVGAAAVAVVEVSAFAGVAEAPKWSAAGVETGRRWSLVLQRVPGRVGRTVGEVAAWVGQASPVDRVVDDGMGVVVVVVAAVAEPESEASEQDGGRSFGVAPPVAAGQDGGACAAESNDAGRASERVNDAPEVDRNLGGCSYWHHSVVVVAAAAVDHGMASAAGRAVGQSAVHVVQPVADEPGPEAGIGSIVAAVVVVAVRTVVCNGLRSCCASTDVVRDERRQVNVEQVELADAGSVGDVAAAAAVAFAVGVVAGDSNGLLAVVREVLVGLGQSLPEQVAVPVAGTADEPVAAAVDDATAAVVDVDMA